MQVLKAIFSDPTFVAHGVGMLGVVGTALAGINPIISATLAALTAVFHVSQTFGNGTAVPPGYTETAKSLPKRGG